jgi:hypothetical protein
MSFSFDTEDAEVQSAPSLIPSGRQTLIVVSVALKDTKDGTGQYFNMLVSDVNSGATSFQMFNMVNKNPVAQDIGRKEFSALFKACGLTGRVDQFTAENLTKRRFVADVSTKTDNFGQKNVLRNFRSEASETVAPATPMGGNDLPF